MTSSCGLDSFIQLGNQYSEYYDTNSGYALDVNCFSASELASVSATCFVKEGQETVKTTMQLSITETELERADVQLALRISVCETTPVLANLPIDTCLQYV